MEQYNIVRARRNVRKTIVRAALRVKLHPFTRSRLENPYTKMIEFILGFPSEDIRSLSGEWLQLHL